MRYEEYEKKIIKRARVYKKIYELRFVWLFLLLFSVAFATIFVLAKGVTIDYKRIRKSYVYGEKYEYWSFSVLNKTIYEFAEQESDNWTTVSPIETGKYKLRAKAKSSFPTYYCGSIQKFEITPKVIDVEVYESQITYGDIPTLRIADQLEFEDYLANDYTFSFGDKTQDNFTITPNADSLHIYSSTGEDVTHCYSFNIVPKEVTVLKRRITIGTGSSSKIYDGTELNNQEFDIQSGSLVEGDTITLKEYTKTTSAGSISNEHSFIIKDGDNVDVTKHYDIVLNPGTLEIKKKDITFKTNNYEFTYDGEDKKFSLDDIIYDADDVVNQQKVTLDYVDDATWINAGTYDNAFEVKITDDDVDVTGNYNITYDIGETVINKRPIKIEGASSSKTYDDTPIKNDSYEIKEGSIADKDEITVSSSEYTESGAYTNNLEVSIKDKTSHDDMIANYDINLSVGEIVINPVELTININKNIVTYDGLPHSNTYTHASGDLVGEDYLEVSKNMEKIEAGTYDNEDMNIIVKKSDGSDNSKNYKINYTGREEALVINKRPLTIETLSKSKKYDAISLRKTMTDENFYDVTSGDLADNEYIEFKYLNDATDAGVYPIQSEIIIYHKVGETKDTTKDTVVTSNYDINFINGDFTIDKRSITIKTIDAEHEYNRDTSIPEELNIFSFTSDCDGLVDGQVIKNFDISCDGINVGIYDYNINPTTFVIEDNSGNDVTSNYLITFINVGKLTITKRQVNVTMLEKHTVYDGTPLSSSEHTVEHMLEDDYLEFGSLPEVTHVFEGHIQNNPGSWKAYMMGGTEVTENYNVNYVANQSIYRDPRPITLRSPSIEKAFDGEPIVQASDIEIVDGSLATASGDTITINSMVSRDDFASIIHAGTQPNIFNVTIYNSDSLNVTGDYDITFQYGDIKIYPCPLVLDVRQNKYVYDGLNHNFVYSQTEVTETSDNIYIVGGTMPDHYHLDMEASINDMKNVGTYNNYEVTYSFHADAPYEYQAGDFSITFNNGSQEIIRRSITIQTLGGSKIKDGHPFGYGLDPEDLFWVSVGSLAAGHELYGYTIEEIVDVCESKDNVISDVKIRDSYSNDVTSNYYITYVFGKVTIYEE